MASAPPPEDAVTEDGLNIQKYLKELRTKILFGLHVYPHLSPSMLHVFLGTSTSTAVWKPILNELIAEGLVCKDELPLETPYERNQTYTLLRLSTTGQHQPTAFSATQ